MSLILIVIIVVIGLIFVLGSVLMFIQLGNRRLAVKRTVSVQEEAWEIGQVF